MTGHGSWTSAGVPGGPIPDAGMCSLPSGRTGRGQLHAFGGWVGTVFDTCYPQAPPAVQCHVTMPHVGLHQGWLQKPKGRAAGDVHESLSLLPCHWLCWTSAAGTEI